MIILQTSELQLSAQQLTLDHARANMVVVRVLMLCYTHTLDSQQGKPRPTPRPVPGAASGDGARGAVGVEGRVRDVKQFLII